MNTKPYCTAAGHLFANQALAQIAQMTSFEHDGNNLVTGSGSNSVREGDANLIDDRRREEATSGVVITTKNLLSFRDSHRVYESYREGYQNFGRLITVERGGKLKKYVLGGVNEPEMYLQQDIYMISYLTPTGRLLLDAETGDEIELPSGGSYIVVSIEDAPTPDPLDQFLASVGGPQVTRTRLTKLWADDTREVA